MVVLNKRKQDQVFAYPRLSKTDLLFVRIGGSGLGNLLFIWARCLSRSKREGWQPVWPTWQSFKPKNWRVNPYDHRTYGGLFQPTAVYISGWRKPLTLARHRWVKESDIGSAPPPPGTVVEFRGMEGKFAPFLHDHALVHRELLRITRPQHLAGYEAIEAAPIGIHVRRGDFVQQDSYEKMLNIDNSLLPLSWYVDALQAVRVRVGADVPACIISDGTDQDLAPLLILPNVIRVEFGSALADLLALSRSRLLIASGSTLGMWASYLGQMPTIWHPRKLLQNVLLGEAGFEFEWAPGDAMPEWLAGWLAANDPMT